MRNFSPVTKMRKGVTIVRTSYRLKFEVENKHGETQSHNFCAYHSSVTSCSCIIATKWGTNDMENTTDKAKSCYPTLQGTRS